MSDRVEQITDWDDAYANVAHIPGGEGFAPRWEGEAEACLLYTSNAADE